MQRIFPKKNMIAMTKPNVAIKTTSGHTIDMMSGAFIARTGWNIFLQIAVTVLTVSMVVQIINPNSGIIIHEKFRRGFSSISQSELIRVMRVIPDPFLKVLVASFS
ncbi:hypothetical protein KGQ27_03750 [Patescibacteria group bacterium]|nr:hypothetical protein [Patescibacteria group bacterium]